jgi:hypothetical protein
MAFVLSLIDAVGSRPNVLTDLERTECRKGLRHKVIARQDAVTLAISQWIVV